LIDANHHPFKKQEASLGRHRFAHAKKAHPFMKPGYGCVNHLVQDIWRGE
jgi:hypothetical protein